MENDYKRCYEDLQKEVLILKEEKDNQIEEIKARDNAIINQLNEEIEFYKNIIKGILHIR